MEARIQIVRENADESGEVLAARPPEAAYGKYAHCGFCSTTWKTSSLLLHPGETHVQCSMCGRLMVLPLKPNPRIEHGPNLTPAA